MLIYHPAGDYHHCCYRFIRLLSTVGISMSDQTLMLCDFFSLFPGQMKYIQGWPRANSNAAKVIKSLPDEFEELLNAKRVFFQLKQVQQVAISYLCAKGLLRTESKSPMTYSLIDSEVPAGIRDVIKSDVFTKTEQYRLITQSLCKLELTGKSGLKSKTGLMEFLYD